MKEFGSIDVLVNNAGITKDNLLMRISEEDFDKVIEVNLKSVFNMTKAVQRTMLKQRKGSIINMSSVVGVKGNAGQTNYAASKAGIIGFSKSVALELGSRNIRSNVIAPGFIETEMTAKLDEATVELVKQFDNILYISCNPETLKNNLDSICETHTIEHFAIFDQFPYTHHLESGVLLKKI